MKGGGGLFSEKSVPLQARGKRAKEAWPGESQLGLEEAAASVFSHLLGCEEGEGRQRPEAPLLTIRVALVAG